MASTCAIDDAIALADSPIDPVLSQAMMVLIFLLTVLSVLSFKRSGFNSIDLFMLKFTFLSISSLVIIEISFNSNFIIVSMPFDLRSSINLSTLVISH